MTADKTSKASPLKRFGPLAAIAVVAALFFASGAYRYLSFDALKENYAGVRDFVAAHFVVAFVVFIAVYIAVTATSVPGAAFLSVSGGLLFGAALGTVGIVIGATIGATIIFLVARTALGNALRARAGGLVKKLENGFRENALSYLLLLRLIPLFPFFVVNIAPAFFGVKTRTFFIATLVGIIPGAFAYASAGNGLGAVLAAGEDVKLTGLLTQPAVLTPIVALSVLALIPILYKRFAGGRGLPGAASGDATGEAQ